LVVFGSYWSAWVIVAVFVSAFGDTTVAWISSVWGMDVGTVPSVHAPVVES